MKKLYLFLLFFCWAWLGSILYAQKTIELKDKAKLQDGKIIYVTNGFYQDQAIQFTWEGQPVKSSSQESSLQPIFFTFLIDASGSLGGGGRKELRNHLRQLVGFVKPEEIYYEIWSFADDIRLEVPEQKFSIEQIESYLRRFQLRGEWTRMYDAIDRALETIQKRTQEKDWRPVIVLITDGVDEQSKKSLASILASIKKANIPLFVESVQGRKEPNEKVLEQLRKESKSYSPHQDTKAFLRWLGKYRSRITLTFPVPVQPTQVRQSIPDNSPDDQTAIGIEQKKTPVSSSSNQTQVQTSPTKKKGQKSGQGFFSWKVLLLIAAIILLLIYFLYLIFQKKKSVETIEKSAIPQKIPDTLPLSTEEVIRETNLSDQATATSNRNKSQTNEPDIFSSESLIEDAKEIEEQTSDTVKETAPIKEQVSETQETTTQIDETKKEQVQSPFEVEKENVEIQAHSLAEGIAENTFQPTGSKTAEENISGRTTQPTTEQTRLDAEKPDSHTSSIDQTVPHSVGKQAESLSKTAIENDQTMIEEQDKLVADVESLLEIQAQEITPEESTNTSPEQEENTVVSFTQEQSVAIATDEEDTEDTPNKDEISGSQVETIQEIPVLIPRKEPDTTVEALQNTTEEKTDTMDPEVAQEVEEKSDTMEPEVFTDTKEELGTKVVEVIQDAAQSSKRTETPLESISENLPSTDEGKELREDTNIESRSEETDQEALRKKTQEQLEEIQYKREKATQARREISDLLSPQPTESSVQRASRGSIAKDRLAELQQLRETPKAKPEPPSTSAALIKRAINEAPINITVDKDFVRMALEAFEHIQKNDFAQEDQNLVIELMNEGILSADTLLDYLGPQTTVEFMRYLESEVSKDEWKPSSKFLSLMILLQRISVQYQGTLGDQQWSNTFEHSTETISKKANGSWKSPDTPLHRKLLAILAGGSATPNTFRIKKKDDESYQEFFTRSKIGKAISFAGDFRCQVGTEVFIEKSNQDIRETFVVTEQKILCANPYHCFYQLRNTLPE